jgi:uncharacterized protein YbaP (TraB family)
MKRIFLAAFPVAFLMGAAMAAPPAPVTDWVPDETVVVAAKAEGPAYWHIKKGDAEIFILGTVGAMPKDLAWNTAHTSAIIKGARVVLTPPVASSNFFSAAWFLLWNRSLLSMPDGKTLQDVLPADLKGRFEAVVAALHGPKPEAFSDDPPLVAALKLENGFRDSAKLSTDEPLETVKKIARANRVKVEQIADYGVLDIAKELLRQPIDKQQVCLDEAVSDVELRMVHARPAAAAWADGDVKAIKAHYTPQVFTKCAKVASSFNKLYDQAVADYMKAIEAALAQPGKVVLITDVGSLLRNTGIAEKLHAEGVTIEGPAE